MMQAAEVDEVTSPYDGSVVGRVPLATASQREAAVAAAVEAFEETRALSRARRAQICRGVADGLAKRSRELAETIARESGKPVQYALAEVSRAVQTFTLAAEEAKRLGGELVPVDIEPRGEGYTSLYSRFPVGPVLAISPFNFPLNLVAHKLAPAIASGCPLVLKPPQQAPITSLKLAEICYEAGLPPKALSVLHCTPEIAEPMVRDDRFELLSFTGSAALGWRLKAIAGKKRVVLELGGNAAAIVHSDADLEWAVERCVLGGFAYAGQVCIKVQRVLIHRPVYDELVAKLVQRTESLKMGDPLDEDTVVGPLIEPRHAERVTAWIDEAVRGGARVLCGGRRDGNLIRPTILAATTPEMKVEREEIFGPVLSVRPYDDFKAAVRIVNDSPYGLQAGVFTHDIRHVHYAFQNLEVGGVIVNDYPTLRFDVHPYGGVKDSGQGREGVRYAIEEMTEIRALVIDLRH
jgi:glyceraldehyde-3-phosphate dehydrogenase (NADP+)